MAIRHHGTMEVGGWTLLLAALLYLLYLLFHKSGQAMLSGSGGGTVVSSRLIYGSGSTPTGPPSVTPTDPSKLSTYTDGSGNVYTWDPTGQQWHASGVKSAAPSLGGTSGQNGPTSSSGSGGQQTPLGPPVDLSSILAGPPTAPSGNLCPCGDVDPYTGETCPCPPSASAANPTPPVPAGFFTGES